MLNPTGNGERLRNRLKTLPVDATGSRTKSSNCYHQRSSERRKMVPVSNSTGLVAAAGIRGIATHDNGSGGITGVTTTTITTRSEIPGGTEVEVSTQAAAEEEVFRNSISSTSSSSSSKKSSGVEIITAIRIEDGVAASLAISFGIIRVVAENRVISGGVVGSRTFNSVPISSSSRVVISSWMEEEVMDLTGMASCSKSDLVKGTETIQNKTILTASMTVTFRTFNLSHTEFVLCTIIFSCTYSKQLRNVS